MAAVILVAACSGDTEGPALTERPPVPERLPLPKVIDSRPFAPELEHAGKWNIFLVPDGGRVVGIVDTSAGPVAVVDDTRRMPTPDSVRLYRPAGDGWTPLTGWIETGIGSNVSWRFVSVLDGSIVLTGRTRDKDEGSVSVVLDPSSDRPLISAASIEDGSQRLQDTVAGDTSLLAISSAYGEGFAIWRSPDGARWDELVPSTGWPSTTVSLIDMTHGDGVWAIHARRAQGRSGGDRIDFVMSSRDGIEWQRATFDEPGSEGIAQLEALGNDGSSLLALGTDLVGRLVTQASTDGVTWSEPLPADPAIFGEPIPEFDKIVSHPDGTFLAGTGYFNTDYRHCYVAGRACGVELPMVWMASDGALLPMVAPSLSTISAVALIDGTLYIGGDEKIATWIPDQPGTMPVVAMPPLVEPPNLDAPPLDSCSTLAAGITYAWVGCEGCADFDGFQWTTESVTDDAAEILAESGAVATARSSANRPVIYGTVELIESGRIEWSIPGFGPIAYLRSGDPLSGSLGCGL